jgi:signal transduction histidine kinase
MQDQGGTIEVKSKINEGTVFILTLKAEPDAKQQNISPGHESVA